MKTLVFYILNGISFKFPRILHQATCYFWIWPFWSEVLCSMGHVPHQATLFCQLSALCSQSSDLSTRGWYVSWNHILWACQEASLSSKCRAPKLHSTHRRSPSSNSCLSNGWEHSSASSCANWSYWEHNFSKGQRSALGSSVTENFLWLCIRNKISIIFGSSVRCKVFWWM